ncbi:MULTISPECIES: HPF/RaiA family ribosome-associated protein [unclassified Roseitalea]|uniref:HPF/RaiA family ribosome-associated protein n=1 Tax=unclassified Roseitalea TaxID=2639107 RepID=UPI00273FBB03|nr:MULTISPECIES: HPF/RaiA family ribosome-associated protein [unclassified Roseitalea]
MQTEPEIAYRGMEPSGNVDRRVHERIARLERFFGRINSCRVIVDAPHRHHRKGNHYAVRIELRVPGGEISVDNEPGDVNAHEDVLVAIRDSFDAAERQLRRWKQTHAGRPQARAAPLTGRIAEIDIERGFGQIMATDGRLVYFHRNAVVDGDFDALSEGSPVELVVDQGVGEGGPHASTVRPISAQAFTGGI